ncbi:alpha/beta fold hydrolase [Micromonospora ureilytica]|uniref:alpha/beta fold hydrolase n=1 Tax=Micromonospora ureilytica TaxID=709868 RepID=UPI00403A2186
MTKVFVHGVPETSLLWGELREQVSGDSVALQLPGFGVPLPDGFVPTKETYAAWLAEELRKIDGPIDLVGHDWGALLTLRVATLGDVPLRSWAVDVAGVFDPNYVWHAWAAALLPKGKGEAILRERRTGSIDDAATFMIDSGVSTSAALAMATAHDEVMSRCILGLYRSAVPNVSATWGTQAQTPTASPGLVLIATGDRVDNETAARETAERLGAQVAVLPGATHFWMFDPTGTAAAALADFWASLP